MSRIYNSVAMLESCNAEIQHQLLQVTSLFSGVREDVLLTSPLPEKWSAKQCVEHLSLTLHLYIPRIKVAISNVSSSDKETFKRGVLGSRLISSLEKDESLGLQKHSIKTFKRLNPGISGKSSIESVIEFSKALKELSECINLSFGKNIHQVRVTSAAGPLLRLKLGDVYPFLLLHNRRHLAQAQRAVELCNKH